MFDESWIELTETREDVLVIMEGVLMYFTKEEVKKAFEIIGKKHKKAVIMCELMCKKAAGMSDKHDTLKHTNATFKWGVDHGSEIADMVDNLYLVSETSFNVEMKKHTFRGWLFATLPGINKLNNRLSIFEFRP